MAELNYVGDTVKLAFEVNVEDIAPLKIDTINVTVFSEEGEIIHEDPVTIVNNVVEYTIDSSMTKHSGDYAASFDVSFTGGLSKTFEMPFVILPRGISKEGAGTHVGKLTEESTEDEVEKAVADDLRNMRRDGKDQMESYKFVLQIAQYKTGKYHRRW